MKIMAISDQESKLLWDYFDRSYLEGIDLIISCGDLKPQYLSFLTTFTNAPVLYVHGNHDERYDETPPEGCICIEDTIYVHNGVRIMGLGGSMRYKPGSHQYTPAQMRRRVRKMWLKLKFNKGFDILVAHAPAYQVNDGEDLPHRGFGVFRTLMDKYKPAFFIHGHVHMNYGRKFPRLSTYNETQVINAYEKYVFEFDPKNDNNTEKED
ncbi:MAG: metallophosphoesterase family protein [Lachnospiraceae bacterium]|nr:metallophosphoesterase family protein [Lachnospiraceae bacterium]